MKCGIELKDSDRSEANPWLLDKALIALASHRRRTVLRILREADDTSIRVSDLVTEMIAREDSDRFIDHDMVVLDLYHRQLPLLAEIGAVEYDRTTGTIRYKGDDEIEALLQSNCSLNSESEPFQ